MYLSARSVAAKPGHMEDTLTVLSWIVGAINDKGVGGDLGVSIELGGDPNAVSVTGTWESLGAYESARAAYMADSDISGAIKMAYNYATPTGDALGQILRPPGDRLTYLAVNFANFQLAKGAEAIPFCLEVAEAATEITGIETGFFRAVTGNASMVGWGVFHASLQDLQDAQDKLDASEDFMAFYKRSEDLMVPNSLEAGIRQYV